MSSVKVRTKMLLLSGTILLSVIVLTIFSGLALEAVSSASIEKMEELVLQEYDMAAQKQMLVEQEQVLARTLRVNVIFISIVGAVFSTGGLILALVISRNIVAPLHEAGKMINDMSDGDFSKNISEKLKSRRDDFGILANQLDSMRQSIGQLIGEIKKSADEIGNNMTNVNGSTSELNGEIEGISATTEELAASMQETAASSEEINAMSAEIREATRRIADRAKSGARTVSEIYSRAETIGKAAREKQADAKRIQKEMQTSLTKALDDARVVKEIETLSAAIMDIAEETDLLALNAAIEAARAGESGKGFAVVAEQIRKLAEESKTTVERIQSVTEAVTNSVGQLSSDSENLLEFVKGDVSEALDTFGGAMERYSQDAAKMNDLITEFEATSADLSKAMDGVMQAMNEITTASQEGAKGTSDIAERSSFAMEKSCEVAAEVRAVDETVLQMHNEMEKFKV